MEELALEFYNSTLRKIVYNKNNHDVDFSRIGMTLNDGETYEYELVFEDKNESILCNVVC